MRPPPLFTVALVASSLALVGACKKDPAAIAELKKADGPVERQHGETPWQPAKIGTRYVIDDAARTADGAAQLEVIGGAQIAMQPHTILRFGGTRDSSKISVELGAIELSGTGNFGFDVGDVRLSQGSVRITAKGKGESSVELMMGDAQVSTLAGQTYELEIGEVFDLSMSDIEVVSIDAGVPVADAAAAIDAPGDAVALAADVSSIEVTGKRAEVLAPGETTWTALPAGAGVLIKGSKIRLGTGTTAKLTGQGTTLDMTGGSRAVFGEDLAFALELGSARASVGRDGAATIRVPGGAVAVKGSAQTGGEAKLDVTARDTRVSVLRGSAILTGATGGEHGMSRGESATVAKNGTVRVLEAIPRVHDFQLAVGESVTIHDPKGVTAVQFAFGGKCPDGGFIEMDRDARYRTAKVSAGKNTANMSVGGGGWAYRLRCSSGSGDSAAVASGRVIVRRDAGSRKLPKEAAINNIDADGRNYRISYQSVIPTIAVRTKGAGSKFKLHLATGGKEETFDSSSPTIKVAGSKLVEGTYTYWFDRDGVRDPKVSTLKIDFDNTAPQVYIELPVNNRAWDGEIQVRGAVLPGWTAAVGAVTIPIDKQRRFSAKVQKPTANALAIKLSHPQRGVHYYLRRASK